MIDLKKIKIELLEAFNQNGVPHAVIARQNALDSVLGLYFAAASHVPRPLAFEAVVNSLAIEQHDEPLSRQKIQAVLNKYQPPVPG